MSTPEPNAAGGGRAARSIVQRFAHVVSAQGVEGVLGTVFFLYLAWLDASFYGEVMYALAVAGVLTKLVQFGLYYPLVSDLGSSSAKEAPVVLARVNFIRFVLVVLAMLFVAGGVLYKGFSVQMSATVFLISLGYALEALSETFFSDLRVRGRQDVEARIKIISSFVAFGYGFGAAAAGLAPILVALYKLLSSIVRLGFGLDWFVRTYHSRMVIPPEWDPVWRVFRAATAYASIEVLGTLYNKTNIFFLETYTGVEGVAFYHATYNLVNPVCILGSQQLLGWVVFPMLAGLWWQDRIAAKRLIRNNALWLMTLAFPIMFFFYVESEFLIGLIYKPEYRDAVWMQKWLIWTIILSFEGNLFQYVMMVIGAIRYLVVFTLLVSAGNLALNAFLVPAAGLLGGCLVLILTKLLITALCLIYCQASLRLFRVRDVVFPLALAGGSLLFFVVMEPVAGYRPAALLTTGLYALLVWKLGTKMLGSRRIGEDHFSS